jgi:hypothetical protein
MPPKLYLLVLLGKQVYVILAGKKKAECFLMHEIGNIDGRRGFQPGRNVF